MLTIVRPAREDVMRWARPKAARASEHKAEKKVRRDTDVEMGGVNNLESSEKPDETISSRIDHLNEVIGEICAVFKGQKGYGKGQFNPNLGKSNQYNPMGKGAQAPNQYTGGGKGGGGEGKARGRGKNRKGKGKGRGKQ